MENGNIPAQAATPEAQPQSGAQAPQHQGGSPTPKGDQKAPQAVSEAAKEAARKLKLKHDDGTEEEIDEAEALKIYKERKKHQAVASRELNEGKAAKKKAETFINMLRDKSKLVEVLKAVGHKDEDLQALMEQELTKKIQYQLMDPKDRDLMEAKQKLSAYEQMEKEQREAVKRQHDEQMRKKYSEQYTQEFISALQSEKVPGNKFTVSEMARYISRSAKIGIEITPKEAAQLVSEDYEERHRALYGDADAEYLMKVLGEEQIKKIRAYDAAQVRGPEAMLKTPQEQFASNRKKQGETKRMTPQEWRKFNRGK